MQFKKIIIILITIISLLFLSGCNNSVNKETNDKTDKEVEELLVNFIDALKDYDYDAFTNLVTNELIDSGDILIDTTIEDNIAFYKNKISIEKFKELRKTMETNMIDSLEYIKKEKTDLTSGYMENPDNEEYIEKNTDKNKQYYKAYAYITLPTIESIENIAPEIFKKNSLNTFKNEPTSKEEAVNLMMNYYKESFDEIYKKSDKEKIEIQFYIYQDIDKNEWKINDTDMMYYVTQIYNEVCDNIDVSSNKYFPDYYYRTALSDEEYTNYKKTGKLPNRETSWKVNQKGVQINTK